jgi:hypothetical protein
LISELEMHDIHVSDPEWQVEKEMTDRMEWKPSINVGIQKIGLKETGHILDEVIQRI